MHTESFVRMEADDTGRETHIHALMQSLSPAASLFTALLTYLLLFIRVCAEDSNRTVRDQSSSFSLLCCEGACNACHWNI